MQRVGRRIFLGCIAVPLFCAVVLILAANSRPGREMMVRGVSALTAGEVVLTDLNGRFPDALHIGRIALHDPSGCWLAIDHLTLDWTPSGLLTGVAAIERLAAERITLVRLPEYPVEAEETINLSLPMGVALRVLQIARLDIAEPVFGRPMNPVAIDGSLHLTSEAGGTIGLSLRQLNGEANYSLQGRLEQAVINARLNVNEPARGLIASFAGLDEQHALSALAVLDGPLSAVQTRFQLTLGVLKASLEGTVDFEHYRTDIVMTAKAQAMRLRPDISWQALALDTTVRGEFAAPVVNGALSLDQLDLAKTRIRHIAMTVQGDVGQHRFNGELDSLKLPDSQTDVLHSSPLRFQAELRQDQAQRPATFRIMHPLLDVAGNADTSGKQHAELVINLPDLKPWTGLASQGNSTLKLNAARHGDHSRINLEGIISAPVRLGDKAKISAAVDLNGDDVALSHFALDAKALKAQAQGKLSGGLASLDWKAQVDDMTAISKAYSGTANMQGKLAGPLDNFAVSTELNAELALKNRPRIPVTAKLRLEHLPNAPAGQVNAEAKLAGSPLQLAALLTSSKDGPVKIALERANWKSVTAKGSLLLAKNAELSSANLDAKMARLEDLQAVLGTPLSGAASAGLGLSMSNGRKQGQLRLRVDKAGVTEIAMLEQAVVELTISDAIRQPTVSGRVDFNGLSAGALTGAGQLELDGTLEALKLRMAASLQNLAGAKAELTGTGDLNTRNKQLTIIGFQAVRKDETLRLQMPAHINFADGVSVDRLRLNLGEAALAMSGRISPTLALTASMHQLPAKLAAEFFPGLALTGTLQADARLNGTVSQPEGNIRVEAEGLRMSTGAAHALPPVKIQAGAEMKDSVATVNASISAGQNANASITGTVSLALSEALDLHATGALDLKLLDPLLNADGRRARGQVALDATLTGSLENPSVKAALHLSKAELRDYGIGANITDITALLKAEDGTVFIDRFDGHAGPGTLSIKGRLDLSKAGMPVDLAVSARNARALGGERLSLNLDSDLAVRGFAEGPLTAVGSILVNRAEIRVPERLPGNIAVLKIRTAGAQTPSPSPKTNSDIVLNLAMNAPRKIFVRGRGLDAELGGAIKVRGTIANPQPDGVFELHRGQFTLAGKTLDFSRGTLSFDGGSLIDPALNFVAVTSGDNVTATLTVSGTASQPKFSFASVPELPQDEVLAYLLFRRSSANLSLMELVQIGSAVASLSGATSGLPDPLESVRKKLSLDRLSVGGANTSVEAGRYVVPGVYLGAKQGISGSSTQANIQIDLSKRLKLEATVGTGAATGKASGANSIGLIYQFEY